MIEYLRILSRALLLSAASAGGVACTSLASGASPAIAAPEASAGHVEARVIVRFQDGRDPTDPAFRARVATEARVAYLEIVRPVSGDAWVMRLGCADPRAEGRAESSACGSALARLAGTDDVRYAELDRRERHQ